MRRGSFTGSGLSASASRAMSIPASSMACRKGGSFDRISDFGEVVTGKTPSTKKADNYDGEIPFIKRPDMHGNVFVIETREQS